MDTVSLEGDAVTGGIECLVSVITVLVFITKSDWTKFPQYL